MSYSKARSLQALMTHDKQKEVGPAPQLNMRFTISSLFALILGTAVSLVVSQYWLSLGVLSLLLSWGVFLGGIAPSRHRGKLAFILRTVVAIISIFGSITLASVFSETALWMMAIFLFISGICLGVLLQYSPWELLAALGTALLVTVTIEARDPFCWFWFSSLVLTFIVFPFAAAITLCFLYDIAQKEKWPKKKRG